MTLVCLRKLIAVHSPYEARSLNGLSPTGSVCLSPPNATVSRAIVLQQDEFGCDEPCWTWV
jgi:hypothetical protein